jgi:hypothetical protein
VPNPLVLPIGPGLAFKEGATLYKVSDHNRSEIDVSYQKIENKKRMADATLRTFVVARKRTWKTSWKDLPRESAYTVDGFMGADAMKAWYDSHLGSFQVVLTNGDNEIETVWVMFDNFNCSVSKRSRYTDLYSVDMSLEEV